MDKIDFNICIEMNGRSLIEQELVAKLLLHVHLYSQKNVKRTQKFRKKVQKYKVCLFLLIRAYMNIIRVNVN